MDKKELLLTDEEIDLCGIKNILTKEDAQFIAKAQLAKASAYYEAEIARILKRNEDNERILNREAAYDERELIGEVKYWKRKAEEAQND